MSDPMNGTQIMRPVTAEHPWRTRVTQIVSGVRREALIYFILGESAYIFGGAACFFVIREPSMTALAVMGFFQSLVIFFATLKIYPCIRGGFLVSLEQACETVDDMRAIRHEIERQGAPIKSKSRTVVEE
ncbi:MAG: hypothetical protein ACREDF_00040 [Thermoplasmata archaeon]